MPADEPTRDGVQADLDLDVGSGRGAPPARRGRWAAGAAGAAVLVGLTATALGTGGITHDPPPVPTPGQNLTLPTSFPSPDRDVPGSGGIVSLTTLCRARTDGRTWLDVSFVVTNQSSLPLRILSVRGDFPIGGLSVRSPTTSGGSCRAPGAGKVPDRGTPGPPRDTPLAPAGRRLYTLHLKLPRTCPGPYPVQADLDYVAAAAGPVGAPFGGSVLLTLFSDLGLVRFSTCPTP